jgi:hypothetical protein
MNWDVVEPALTRLLKETEDIKNALEERKREQESILQKVDLLLQKPEKENGKVALTTQDIKLLLGVETEKIKKLLQEYEAAGKERKGWALFSSDLKAHAFKIVFESVCKWVGILVGGFYLLHSILSFLKQSR